MKKILKKWFKPKSKRAVEQAKNVALISSSDYFDADWYLKHNQDVASSGIDPVVHYLNHGAQEGRLPGPLFDSFYYLAQVSSLPELRQNIENPLLHYLNVGKAAGLQAFSDLESVYINKHSNHFAQSFHFTYKNWIKVFDEITEKDRLYVKGVIAKESLNNHFYLVNLSSNTEESIYIHNLDNQLYSNFTSVSRSIFFANLRDWQNKWVVLFDEQIELREHALFWLANEIKCNTSACVIYSDHDVKNAQGERGEHWFKPDWSPEYFLANSYFGGFVAIKITPEFINSLQNQSLPKSLYEFVLKTYSYAKPFDGDAFKRYIHIPSILFHQLSENKLVLSKKKKSLENYFFEQNQNVELFEESCFLKLLYQPSITTKVSIIVPTKDRLDVLKPCVLSVLNKSTYNNFELLVVNNQSEEPDTYRFFEELKEYSKVRVLDFNKPFNFSAINNFAVQEANGEVICLLNNDTEVIDESWLETMLGQLEQPNVGAVGAKLLFANGSVQHIGDAVGPGGCADHFLSGLGGEEKGYGNLAIVAHEVSAVTAACLLTTKAIFTKVGGLDEKNLPVAFNDVDFCLRIRERGYRIVMTPYARFYHYESISRGKDISPEKAARADRELRYMQKRWAKEMKHDPFYNPNLNYARPDFELNRAPKLKLPWKSFEIV